MLFFDDKLLLKYSGVTGSLLARDRVNAAFGAAEVSCIAYGAYDYDSYDSVFDANDAAAACEQNKPLKPFESSSDAALSALSIIFAPMLLTLLALDEMLSFIVFSLKFMAILCTSGTDEAKELGVAAVKHLFNAFKALLAAVVSPVVNTVDFVGSCVAPVTQGDDEQGRSNTNERSDDDDCYRAMKL